MAKEKIKEFVADKNVEERLSFVVDTLLEVLPLLGLMNGSTANNTSRSRLEATVHRKLAIAGERYALLVFHHLFHGLDFHVEDALHKSIVDQTAFLFLSWIHRCLGISLLRPPPRPILAVRKLPVPQQDLLGRIKKLTYLLSKLKLPLSSGPVTLLFEKVVECSCEALCCESYGRQDDANAGHVEFILRLSNLRCAVGAKIRI